MSTPHPAAVQPSEWVCRWAPRIAQGGRVLDLACGNGRNARQLAMLGLRVDAVDRDAAAMANLRDIPGICVHVADLECGHWPFAEQRFDGIVVTNYLHRPLLPRLAGSLAPAGVLIYETFASGNERFGRPTNPAFLLRPGELLDLVRDQLRVIAYEHMELVAPRASVVQRICAQA